MAILISAHKLTKSFTARPLFSEISFAVESGDRIGLIGPNGAGKSTLLKIIAGHETPDDGTVSIQRGLKIAFLEQVPRFSVGITVEHAVSEGIHDRHDWEENARVQEVMAKMSLSPASGIKPETLVSTLSGGVKKRVALARELVKRPDLLLLDEPTNHLDIESILWLEDFLAHASFATLTITHDRLFLQKISNRIVELDKRHKDGILSVKGDYATYLETREQLLAAQEATEQKLKNTLRRETEWLRRGALARQTKQQARIQNAADLKKEVEELGFRNQRATARLEFQSLEKNPKKLIEAKSISKSFGDNLVLPPLDLLVSPQSRLGLLGANGSGKSTLIKILLGELKPDTGTVLHAERLKAAYFEQNRESLDPEKTLMDTICPKGEWVDYQGQKVHAKGYLARFLFSYEQMGLAVGKLSGGEQSRLCLARLMLTEANVLVLDEPTNDLDMATLGVLSEVLKEFNGAVILVTHDRYFLDQVASRILFFGSDSQGKRELTSFTGLDQWEAWFEERKAGARKTAVMNSAPDGSPSAATSAARKKKLGFKEQRELGGMEERIQIAEKKRADLESEIANPENSSNSAKLLELTADLHKTQTEIDRLYARWAELS